MWENDVNSQALRCCLVRKTPISESISIQGVSEWIHGTSSERQADRTTIFPYRTWKHIDENLEF